jgi:hypothetical protein
LLCEADRSPAEEWVRRFQTVDVAEVREKCMRRAANEFEFLLKGYDIRSDMG